MLGFFGDCVIQSANFLCEYSSDCLFVTDYWVKIFVFVFLEKLKFTQILEKIGLLKR